MATLTNYDSTRNMWGWTGLRNLNQFWSRIDVDEPILVNRIDIHWGGYDRRTSGKHFIARLGSNGTITGIVVQSKTISVPQGRGWRTASVKQTLLTPGTYAVGVWGEYVSRRTFSIWNSPHFLYLATKSSIDGTTGGISWNNNGRGVIPVRLQYESAGRMRVRVNGSWRAGQAHVKVGGTWRKAKTVWVKSGGTWRRGR